MKKSSDLTEAEIAALRKSVLEKRLDLTLDKGLPIYVVRGIPKRHIDALYTAGYNFYTAENYIEAQKVFRSMSFYSHLDKRGWMGLAASTQMLKDYKAAIGFYSYAALLDHENPIPILHKFDCFMALKKTAEALAAIEEVILLSTKESKYTHIKDRAEALRDALKK